MEELNRCPFCGGKAEIEGRKKIRAVCQDCGASSPVFDFKSQAVSFWNIRATAMRSRHQNIVYCKDCKYYHKDDKWCDKNSHFDGDSAMTFDENQFCSLGEKI